MYKITSWTIFFSFCTFHVLKKKHVNKYNNKNFRHESFPTRKLFPIK